MREKKRGVWQKKRRNKDRKRGEERHRLAGGDDCRVSSCKINGGMLFFFFPAGIYSSCYGNRPKPAGLFLETSPVLQVHRDRPDSFAGRV